MEESFKLVAIHELKRDFFRNRIWLSYQLKASLLEDLPGKFTTHFVDATVVSKPRLMSSSHWCRITSSRSSDDKSFHSSFPRCSSMNSSNASSRKIAPHTSPVFSLGWWIVGISRHAFSANTLCESQGIQTLDLIRYSILCR